MSAEVRTRVLSAAEVAATRLELTGLLRAALAGSPSARRWPLEEEIEQTLDVASSKEASVTLVAEWAGAVVGALFTERRHDGGSLFVRWIVVHPSCRRTGVGRTLVEHLEATTTATEVQGMVDLDDPIAAGFWQARGWTPLRPPPRRVRIGRALPIEDE